MHAAIVTISDRSFRGERPDASGPVLKTLVEAAGVDVIEMMIIPDDELMIAMTLTRLVDEVGCALVLTTGGTGLSPRDVTPEATMKVITRRLPGLEMAILHDSLTRTPFGMLSRAVIGARGQSLVANFPGSPKAVKECFAVIQPVLGHVMKLLRDEDPHAHVVRR